MPRPGDHRQRNPWRSEWPSEWPGPAGAWSGGRRGRPSWGPRRGFGCLFGLLFMLVAGSFVVGSAIVVSQLGPLPGLFALGVVLVALAAMGRALGSTARTLDRLVDATRKVEAGDYSVRVGRRRRGLRSARELADGFDTMVARLEIDERQRRTLLADVSHELRTPLAVVQGNLEAILDGVYPPDPAHLGPILEETRVLGRLIDDLRTLALSEAGTLALHREPTDVEVLIDDVVRSFEAVAAAAHVTLEVAIDDDLPMLDIDPVRLREVLGNLIANALRHTPAGGTMTVTGRLESDGRWIRIEVRDTGSGIDPALLPHVFDRFVTGDSSRGSGLGLAIARQLTEAFGGEIGVESAPGHGTTMRVRLPLTGG